MKWGRFMAFLLMAVIILGVTVGTAGRLWKSIPLGLDLQGGFNILYQVQTPHNQTLTANEKQALVKAVEMRINTMGVSSPNIDFEGHNQIRVQMAGTFNQQKAAKLIGETAQLKIYSGGKVVTQKDKATGKKVQVMVPSGKLLATGADLKSNAQAQQDPTTGQNEVAISFKDPKLWQNITTKYLNKQIYVFLNGTLLTDPTIDSKMYNGNSVISGGTLTTVQACQDLAKELNAGALPYPLKKQSESSVGPTLGQASLRATLWAGMIAVILIFIFMMLVYRMAGLIADLALIGYGYLTLVIFDGLHVVLTLPGLAALILGVGMAVDANIIAYERIKDEMRNGRSLKSAVKIGNKNALRTILDSNATTFIAGAVMYFLGGQGDIRGFAVALMISIIVSLLTAVLLSRLMFFSFVNSNILRRPWWFGIGKGVLKKDEA